MLVWGGKAWLWGKLGPAQGQGGARTPGTGIFHSSDGAGNLARSFYVHVKQDLRKYLVPVQAPQVLPCWRSRNGCSLPTSVCLSVPGSRIPCLGPCSPLAVHPYQEGKAASASQHWAGVEPCIEPLQGQGTFPAPWLDENLWPCSTLLWQGEVRGSSVGGSWWLLCGDEVMSAGRGMRCECGWLWRTSRGCLLCPPPHLRRRAGHACGLQQDVGCSLGPDSLCSLPTVGMALRGSQASCQG